MRNIRQVNIENSPYYFFNDIINIKNFDSNLLDIRKLSSETTDEIIYNIKNYNMESLNTEDLSYFIFNNIDGYIEESSENKYLIILQIKTKKY